MTVKRLHSLLDEPLFSVRLREGEQTSCTLPEIFGELVRDDIISFEALQAHQKQAWYCFLVQTAAMALDQEGIETPTAEAEIWREWLVKLGDSSEETWCLVVTDWSKPAFFQPPIPEGAPEEAGYDQAIETPDRLDMLITSKNHDLKRTRIHRPQLEHWIYALVNLQTMEGYGGAGNYGISRMNGGYSNRPFVGVTPGLSWGARFSKDLTLSRKAINEGGHVDFDRDGFRLLWNRPWSGSKECRISLQNCHPLFVEICRRIRFRSSGDDELVCLRTTTQDYRIQGVRDLNGVLDDPWVPIETSEPKAFTLSGRGFDYERLQELWLGEEYESPPSLNFLEHERKGGFLIAAGLARGQSESEGLYRRIIPVPKHVTRLFQGDDSRRKQLGERAQQRVELAGTVQSNILYPALQSLMKAGNDEADVFDVNSYLNRFDDTVDRRFFEDLWASIEQPEDQARADWQKTLFDLARDVFEDAVDSVPIPSVRRYRAISEAEEVFWGTTNSVLPRAFDWQPNKNDQSGEDHVNERA